MTSSKKKTLSKNDIICAANQMFDEKMFAQMSKDIETAVQKYKGSFEGTEKKKKKKDKGEKKEKTQPKKEMSKKAPTSEGEGEKPVQPSSNGMEDIDTY